MDITFVSVYLQIYDTIHQDYVEHFKTFAKNGYPIVLFLEKTNTAFIEEFAHFDNIIIRTDIGFDDLPKVVNLSEKDAVLPKNRNLNKDTYKYLMLINSKIDFAHFAISDVKTEKMAFIDFGIYKIFGNLTNLPNIENIYIPKNKVLIPGIHTTKEQTLDNVDWRFAGALFFCYKDILPKFAEINTKMIESFYPSITWEVNIWAKIEHTYPNLIQWYKGSHDDTILNYPLLSNKRVIVTLMIKNEEHIIRRCINQVLSIADAILISDTGSTDNTIHILQEYLPMLSIPAKLVGEEWKNFGHNRTLSFLSTVDFCEEIGWDKQHTYSLVLDADMNFVLTDKFDKKQLTEKGYRIKQKNPGLEYYNTRFMKLSHPWKCAGVTHEYWDGSETHSLDTVYIDDIGDGGCKSDKFTRDEKLLREGLKEDPKNVRYMFYLAQTLKDLKNIPESIEWYKRRSEAGGWFEEVWYSMYQISRLYYELDKIPEMEFWGQKAYDYNKNRSENLYFLTRVFRERSEHFKAWHYYKLGETIKKTEEMLFVESAVYDHLFDYEKTILNYYVYPERQKTSLKEIVTYMNKQGTGCWINLQFYVSQIPSENIRQLNYKQIDDYLPTSISVLKMPNSEYMLNIRYVNYRIQQDGSYIMAVNNQLSRTNPVKTRNFKLMTDANFNAIGPLEEMTIEFPKKNETNIQGLEDIRLYKNNNYIKWIGTSMEFSDDGKIKQIYGDYSISDNKLRLGISLKSPTNSDCEKNWIPLNNNKFIYKWHPYTVGNFSSNEFITEFIQTTPRFFEHMRGSSNVVEYNNTLYTITHVVMYSQPRKYYHNLVKLNKNTYKIEQYTMPFYFKNNHIEYCLGIEIKNGILYAFVSQNDRDPIIVEIKMDTFEFNSV